MYATALISFIAIVFIAGCAPPQTEKPEKKRKSTLQTSIDGFTGKTAVKAGKKAEAVIRDTSAKRNEDLNEALEEF
jgi:hypothetical protein